MAEHLLHDRQDLGVIAYVLKLSRQCAEIVASMLRNLGLVEGERHGRSIVYALYDNHVAELLDQAVYHSEHLRLGAVDRPAQKPASDEASATA